MKDEKILSSIWTRVLVFFWFIIFPLFAFLIPAFEMLFESREISMFPVYGFLVWILGPIAGWILLKNFFGWGGSEPKKETENRKNND